MSESYPLWRIAETCAGRHGDEVFITDQWGETLTFDQLFERAEHLAQWLSDRGLEKGRCAMWQLPTQIDAAVLTIALSLLGVNQVPVLPIYGWRELSFIVGETEADVLISPNKSSARQTEDYGQLRSLCPDLQFLALPQLDSSLGARFRPDRSVDSDSWVFYTSGTTASPKGARHSDSTIRACATGIIERYEITSSDRVAIVWPVSHIGGIAWVYAGLEARCRLLFVERFGREAVWALRDGGVTLAGAGLPFLIEYLAAQKTLPEGTRLFPEVRAFTSGGMTKPPSIHYEIKEACGSVGVLGSYGMTEAPILTAARPGMMDWEIASTEGPPMDGVDLRVVREDGSSAEIGEEGEIRVRAPQLMLGYVDPSLEIGAFDADGYFITGDLGSVDGAGNLAITGRKKDVIIRKGENISAKELEDALIDIPGVDDVAVIGVPDAATGERVCAVVVASGKAPDLIEVGRHLADRGFMRQKWPEQIEVVSALPRSDMGKVNKVLLRKQMGASSAKQ